MIDAQTWYQTIGANGTGYVGSMYVYSMTNVRLGELTLGYDIPINKWCKWISGLNVSFVGIYGCCIVRLHLTRNLLQVQVLITRVWTISCNRV